MPSFVMDTEWQSNQSETIGDIIDKTPREVDVCSLNSSWTFIATAHGSPSYASLVMTYLNGERAIRLTTAPGYF
jgi:hypothetical protein